MTVFHYHRHHTCYAFSNALHNPTTFPERNYDTMNVDDEFVADSEGEEDFMETGRAEDVTRMNWQDEISTFNTASAEVQRVRQQEMSSISDFSAQLNGGETSTTISTFTTPSVKPPRPRPRPVPPKKKVVEGVEEISAHIQGPSKQTELEQSTSRAAEGFGEDWLGDFPPMSSIADRAKTRQRKQPGPSVATNWGDDDLFSPQPKKKAQAPTEPDYMPSGKGKKAKGKGKASRIDDVLEISSDDDELNLMKVTPKPKAMPSPHTSSLIPTEPVAKPPRPRPRPVPKKPKGTGETPNTDNPASTPANPPPDSDLLSSRPKAKAIPSSLPPSDPPVPTAQTNAHSLGFPPIETLPQPRSSNDREARNEVDELFSGDEDLFGPEPAVPVQVPSKLPPPTFFTGSSSQVNPIDGHTSVVQEEVLDLTMLPTQIPGTDGKLKAKRKKKTAREEEEDEEWGVATSKTKEKKASKKKARPQVEVVISTKPPGRGKGSKSKKKKDDEPSSSGKGKTKEAFKSREMIEDSDEDPLLEPYQETSHILSHSDKDRLFDSGVAQQPSSKEPIPPPDDDLAMWDDDEVPVVRKESRRKRKSVVVDDDEDFGEGSSRMEQSSSKRRKKEKKAEEEGAGGRKSANPEKPSNKKQKGKSKAAVVISEDEEEPAPSLASPAVNEEADEPDLSKENIEPVVPEQLESLEDKPPVQSTPKPATDKPRQPRHSIGSRVKATPMSELIKRVNSLPNSPFPPATSSRLPTISRIATSYSPYLKASRSMLSRIAPLHPNRREPPPPLPPPPPRKKTKKELEREEKWEEELIESLGGLEAWIALSDVERRDMRKAKFDMEMGGWDD
ncbi:hypothetical protein NMY22_g421 [Coprinellus aureogranulatus]|nr:hypothetical protein NMY22_g421 [Coprinellus aureogranulatus]